MLEELDITGLGVIDEAHLQFTSGLNVITGETGAGKTMLLTSVGWILGAAADTTKVRHGAERASVDATFSIDEITDEITETGAVIDEENGQNYVTISRTVPAQGRSKCGLGGRTVPRGVLESIGGSLIVIHGQSDQLRLKSPSAQLSALDRSGGESLSATLSAYRHAWAAFVAARTKLADFDASIQESARQRLALTALVEAVDEVEPEIGEEDDLKKRIDRLDTLEERRSAFYTMLSLLNGSDTEPGATGHIAHIAKLSEGYDVIPDLTQVLATLTDVENAVRDELVALETDENLNDLQARRATLISLSRKLGMSVDEAIVEADHARETLANLGDPEHARKRFEHELDQARETLEERATELTAARRKAATVFTKAVNAELEQLALGRATITVDITDAEPGPNGANSVGFMFAPDKGVTPVPLGSSASGGELSRIMLAIEIVLAQLSGSQTPTFIFDEIDAGVGGVAAKAIGARLAALAEHSQVIVVTHLAQVAAFARQHIVVTRGDGATTISHVDGEKRTEELARMLSGSTDLESALRHAEDLRSQLNVGR